MRGTRIPTHHYGCSLPHESPAVGNGYAASGEVKTYTLPPEEIARIFGQAKKPKGKAPFKLMNPYQREANEMAKENRLERLRKALTKEEYLAQKEKGIADADICAGAVGYVWRDCMIALKKEWGLVGVLPNPGNAKKKEEIKQAVKVDIERPKAEPEEGFVESPIEIEPPMTDEQISEAFRTAIKEACGEEKHTLTVTFGKEVSALDAAHEFYVLQEEVDELTAQRSAKLDRMMMLKTALENAVVVI